MVKIGTIFSNRAFGRVVIDKNIDYIINQYRYHVDITGQFWWAVGGQPRQFGCRP